MTSPTVREQHVPNILKDWFRQPLSIDIKMDFQHDVPDERPPKRQHIETSNIMEDFTSPSEALKMAEDTAVIEGTSTTVEGKGKRRRDRRATSYHKGDKGRESSARPAGPKAPRCPKRQCALLIGFCGSGYSGMQMYVTK